MEWVRENWFFVIFAIIFIAMHLFGFGCGGGHRGHGRDEEKEEHKEHTTGKSSEEKKGGHGCC